MLRLRVIIGAALIAGVLALLLADGYLERWHGVAWAPGFFTVVGLAAVCSVYEMAQLFRRRRWRVYEMPALATILAMLSLAAVSHVTGNRLLVDLGPVSFGPVLLVVMLLFVTLVLAEVFRTWRSDGTAEAVQTIGGTMIVVLYLGLLLLFVVAVRFFSRPDGLWALLLTLAAAKGCDVGAYFTGRFLGRHKLIPLLSPGKTIEGCLGGLVLAVAASLAMGMPLVGLTAWQAALFGLAVGLAAIVGDLVESLWKRAAGAKDSSRALPGFGGVLDIIDSAVMAAPAAYLVLLAFGAN